MHVLKLDVRSGGAGRKISDGDGVLGYRCHGIVHILTLAVGACICWKGADVGKQALTMLAQAAVSVDIAGVERVGDGDSDSVVGLSKKWRGVDSPQAFPLIADVHCWCVNATVPTIIDNARSRAKTAPWMDRARPFGQKSKD